MGRVAPKAFVQTAMRRHVRLDASRACLVMGLTVGQLSRRKGWVATVELQALVLQWYPKQHRYRCAQPPELIEQAQRDA